MKTCSSDKWNVSRGNYHFHFTVARSEALRIWSNRELWIKQMCEARRASFILRIYYFCILLFLLTLYICLGYDEDMLWKLFHLAFCHWVNIIEGININLIGIYPSFDVSSWCNLEGTLNMRFIRLLPA
jgi:hypothetical protein